MSSCAPGPSSGTLWAQATKEWVIPPKVKPGRKKKEEALVSDDQSTDGKAKKVQNRAAQRAFRERKQSQLAELQARINSYEQGEIERNVALQSAARRLKAENDELRKENTALKEEIAILRTREVERGHSQSVLIGGTTRLGAQKRRNASVNGDSAAKKHKAEVEAHFSSLTATSTGIHQPFYTPLDQIQLTSSTSTSTSTSLSVPSPNAQDSPGSIISSSSHFSPAVTITVPSSSRPSTPDPPAAPTGIPAVDSVFQPISLTHCGFCSDATDCVCRSLIETEQATQHMQDSSDGVKIEPDAATSPIMNSLIALSAPVASTAPETNVTSILDNLPEYQPPVPLPFRPSQRQGKASIHSFFSSQPVFSTTSTSTSVPTSAPAPSCSGNPGQCTACENDPMAQKFCAALDRSGGCPGGGKCCGSSRTASAAAAALAEATMIPTPPSDSSLLLCCGDPRLCGGGCGIPSSNPEPLPQQLPPPPSTTSTGVTETMPCSAAWAQLKSHPAINFADLTMLAEVVSRRSKCTGPRVTMSPNPEELSSMGDRNGLDARSMIGTASGSLDAESERPRLVPQEALIKCGRQRVMEVQAEGVREALAVLDSHLRVGMLE